MLDSNGKPIEIGKRYALSIGSRSQLYTAMEDRRFGLCFMRKCNESFDVVHGDCSAYTIERFPDWTRRVAHESRLEQLREIEEQRDHYLRGLDELEKRTAEILFGGYTEQSRDEILGFVRDARGAAEELLEKVQAGT